MIEHLDCFYHTRPLEPVISLNPRLLRTIYIHGIFLTRSLVSSTAIHLLYLGSLAIVDAFLAR
ncbi:MAG: hypothetical protein NDF52_07635 [archaeon YNP-WB-062]|nr:hypothetical protein [Candidatus Culexarchaeum yellowstonense]